MNQQETLSSQLPVFEQFLDTAPKSGGYDAVRQCVVLLVGSLARHLAPGDARVRPIALRLVAALNTPSQQVFFYIYYKKTLLYYAKYLRCASMSVLKINNFEKKILTWKT